MWKQYVNLVLGLLVMILAYAGVNIGWIVASGALVMIVSFWAAVEGAGMEESKAVHIH